MRLADFLAAIAGWEGTSKSVSLKIDWNAFNRMFSVKKSQNLYTSATVNDTSATVNDPVVN